MIFMEEKKDKSLEKPEDKKPISRIKTKNFIVIGIALFIILVWALFRMSASPKETPEIQSEEPATEISDNSNLGFEIVDYSKTKTEEEKLQNESYLKKEESDIKNSNENSDINSEIVEQEVKKNEKLDAYYETMLADELAARSAVIEFGIESPEPLKEEGSLPNINIGPDLSKLQTERISDDINKQPEKKAFLSENPKKNYNEDILKEPISKYEIKAGGIIPGVMLTGINSDLPGTMTANVREDVYDTVTGRILLIPKGTRVIGKYSSSISFGQSRVLVVWQRLIFPNGKSINLENFEGADMSGYSGLVGTVDNHTLKLFQGVILSSILGAAAGIIDDNGNNNNNNSWRNNAGRGAGEEIVTIGEAIASRLLAVQPTIKIAPGSRFNIMVNSDLILEPYNE
ncbi:conjugal transfer protein TrbI [Fusobacterium animalis]|uniref:Conjugal transfer protein TrbI n=3 Tax=Fusobacterium animalis TaxID=76859 RepID=A0A2G9FGN5_9FUSO|nr:conjugal transfer protein TrbI [Fusobacterium animalis]PIM94607.1 conjugal transfer protein TrbI [Fusobacterium animalis]